MQSTVNRRFFHTYDALRFFASFIVFLLHLPITAFPVFNFFRNCGGVGVTLFFVLSGFLISYLLFDEKETTSTVSLKNFYLRRVLRIVPLSYLMLLFAMLTPFILNLLHLPYSSEGYKPNFLLSALFLENYSMMIHNSEPNVAPLGVMWSLCVEMQFYLVWGIIVKFVNNKIMPYMFTCFIFFPIIARAVYFHFGINSIDLVTNIDYFTYGAIPAFCLVKYRTRMETFIESINILIKWLSIIVIAALVLSASVLSYKMKFVVMPSIWGFAFAWLVTIFVPQNTKFKLANSNILSKFGKYTYGFYLFQCIWIMFLVKVFGLLNLDLTNAFFAIIFCVLSFALSIFTAKLSYNYFEKPFLKLRNKI